MESASQRRSMRGTKAVPSTVNSLSKFETMGGQLPATHPLSREPARHEIEQLLENRRNWRKYSGAPQSSLRASDVDACRCPVMARKVFSATIIASLV
jgi:hypothetical protein